MTVDATTAFVAAAFLLMTFALVGVIIEQVKPAIVLAVLAGLCAFGAAVSSLPRPPQAKDNGGRTRAQSMREGKTAMNIEAVDVASLRLPRTPRRPVGMRDNRWIEQTLREIGSSAISSTAAPDRLTNPRDDVARGGLRLRAA